MADELEGARVRMDCQQGLLFPRSSRDLCKDIGLNWATALRLHENGRLSFDPKSVRELTEGQEAELAFVGSLIVGGCDEGMLAHLLADLQEPYCYRPGSIYYDWSAQTWKVVPRERDPEETFEEWLDELAGSGELDRLKAIAEDVEAAIARIEEEQPREEDESA